MTPLEEVAHIATVRVGIDVQLDQRRMKLSEILALEEGSIIELTRSAGENIDILVGGAPLGSGEVVVLEDIMGIRITDFREA